MNRFDQRFTVHPVGQGFYYSGEISVNFQYHPEARFNMVFDCGSISATTNGFSGNLFHSPDPIDLLVISHFDADHVNQIGVLLKGGRKIKKLVLPFLNFDERLFIALRYVASTKGYNPEDAFTIQFIIDPLGTLGENFDDDSEIFFVQGDPDNPTISPQETGPSFSEEGVYNENNLLAFDFDLKEKPPLSPDEQNKFKTKIPKRGKITKVLDSTRGILSYTDRYYILILTEFLFYNRPIGAGAAVFYEEVRKQFYTYYNIDPNLPDNILLNETIEAIKEIRGATKIKAIFKNCLNLSIPGLNGKGRAIDNMNTTALCMLHHNLLDQLRVLFSKFGKEPYIHGVIENNKNDIISDIPHSSELNYGYSRYWNLYPDDLRKNLIYPNAILTSDSFQLSQVEADALFNKYRHYWKCFWLFQIPHHGSRKNSNKTLYSKLFPHIYYFINYGINHRFIKQWKHPSFEVVKDLLTTGHLGNMMTITENQYLSFAFSMDSY